MTDPDRPIFFARFKVGSHIVKKNNRPIMRHRGRGTTFIGKSTELRQAESHMSYELFKAKRDNKISYPIMTDIHCQFRFFFKDFYTKQGVRKLTLPDLSNLIQLPEDCLQEAEIIGNDTQIISLDGSRRLPGEANVLEISIWLVPE